MTELLDGGGYTEVGWTFLGKTQAGKAKEGVLEKW